MALDIVQDVGVVGKKDDRCGEIPVAFIVLSGFGREQAALNPDVVKDKIKLHVQATKVRESLCFRTTLIILVVNLQMASRGVLCAVHSKAPIWEDSSEAFARNCFQRPCP